MIDKEKSKRKTILIDKDVYMACDASSGHRGLKLYEYINIALARYIVGNESPTKGGTLKPDFIEKLKDIENLSKKRKEKSK